MAKVGYPSEASEASLSEVNIFTRVPELIEQGHILSSLARTNMKGDETFIRLWLLQIPSQGLSARIRTPYKSQSYKLVVWVQALQLSQCRFYF